jgi:hypothetical protein
VTPFLVSSGPQNVRVPRVSRLASIVLFVVPVLLGLAVRSPSARAADDATTQARSHYEVGLKLFDAREHEQALIEFQAANELKTRPAALFMMAQCEYLLGRLKEARAHYARYTSENPDGEFVELAKDRVQSIDKRPSTFVINTVPDDVAVRIRAEGTPTVATDVTGQAPNNFQIPRGRYRIDVTKANYQGQTRVVDVDIAETKPLFFKLDPIPARLEIDTLPPFATLYVNGNRARNPYRQDIAPGHVEVFAEAPNHESKTVDLTLSPGEHKRLLGPDSLRLPYAQRSGRPELIAASAVIGGFVGAGAVAAAIGGNLEDPNVAAVLLLGGGGIVGIVAGALIATPLVPQYIPDNRALYVLGDMWIGGLEGAAAGIVVQQFITHHDAVNLPCVRPCRPSLGVELRAGFFGSLPGLALGLTAGALTADRAPTYGRAAIIQSAALGGVLAGALGQMALRLGTGPQYSVHGTAFPPDDPKNPNVPPTTQPDGRIVAQGAFNPTDRGMNCQLVQPPAMVDMQNWAANCAYQGKSLLDLAPGALIGLNLGLAAGLLAAYLPDQTKYGPSWKRVLLVDLAVGAGALAGGIAGCVANGKCLNTTPDDDARAIAAGTALAGGVIGFVGGYFLTRHVDDDTAPTSAVASTLTLVPTMSPGGGALPGLMAMATF